MFTPFLIAALGVWLLWPESARRVSMRLHRPFGLRVDSPRTMFIRLVGLTWLVLLAWFTLTEGW